ncbi:hypothetical protein BDR03DRAFT_1014396 [Suillus americanus]|nr:hypothetical protein BDR03DRAFT_1014396 [Suillus americanus]
MSVLKDIYNGASQCIHEWRAAFGSTAVGILMAFFASTPEYQAQEAREEYAEYQLQDCHFIYEDPNNEEQPGPFLSEYMLRIFAAHLTTISGKVRVDALIDFVQPGYATALALLAVSAERALVLVQNCLLVDTDPSDNGGKTHKIIQTLNEATNKMSHTRTAFSSGNWETDTMAYMESIKDLPYEHIQEILIRAEGYMKHTGPHRRTSNTADKPSCSSSSIAPVNKCSHLHFCNVHSSSFVSTANNIHSTGASMHNFSNIVISSFPVVFQLIGCQELQAVALLLTYYTLFLSPLDLLSNLDTIHHLA